MQQYQIPSVCFLTQRQILGDKKTNTPAIIPVGPTTWWKGVKAGRYPKGIKISPGRIVWRAEDIQALVKSFG